MTTRTSPGKNEEPPPRKLLENPWPHSGTWVLLVFSGLILFAYWKLFSEPASVVKQDASLSATEEILFTPQGGSPELVFAVAALLFYSRAGTIRASLTHPAWILPGVALVIAAALSGLWAHYVSAPDLMIPSLIFMLLGSAALLGGRPCIAAVAAPAVFLIFAIPIPAAVVNELIWPLQLATAQSADWILSLLGYQPKTWGDIIFARGKIFHVIESCSGMGMIHTMIMAGALYSILFYRSRAQVILIMLAAPAIAYFVNALRVVSIVINPFATWSSVHTTQGIVMIILGVLLIAGFDRILDLVLPRRPAKTPPHAPVSSAQGPRWGAPAFVFTVLIGLGIATEFTPTWNTGVYSTPRIITLPSEMDGVPGKMLGKNKDFLGSVGFLNSSSRAYTVHGIPVSVTVYSDDRLDRRRSLLSPKIGYPGPGWEILEEGQTEMTPGGGEVDFMVLGSEERKALVYWWYEGLGSRREEILRNAIGLDQSPFRRERDVLAVRISTPILSWQGSIDAARARARLRLIETARTLEGKAS